MFLWRQTPVHQAHPGPAEWLEFVPAGKHFYLRVGFGILISTTSRVLGGSVKTGLERILDILEDPFVIQPHEAENISQERILHGSAGSSSC